MEDIIKKEVEKEFQVHAEDEARNEDDNGAIWLQS